MAGRVLRVPYAEAVKSPPRDALLDAATELLRDRPWSKITMTDVADRAGVSRQTLYKEFGSRRDFAKAYIERRAFEYVAIVVGAVRANPRNPHDAVRAALHAFLDAAINEPLIQAIADDNQDGLLAMITDYSGPLLRVVDQRLAEFLATQWPRADRVKIELLSTAMVRLAVSHAVSPVDPPDKIAADITTVLAPFVDAVRRQD